jgi:hypothetical protein
MGRKPEYTESIFTTLALTLLRFLPSSLTRSSCGARFKFDFRFDDLSFSKLFGDAFGDGFAGELICLGDCLGDTDCGGNTCNHWWRHLYDNIVVNSPVSLRFAPDSEPAIATFCELVPSPLSPTPSSLPAQTSASWSKSPH